jgi:hypothetical protein
LLFHGGHFRRRSSPTQSISARDSCFSRCTTSPAIYWFLNHPKRSSMGEVIVFQSWLQKSVSSFRFSMLLRLSVFRRASPETLCAVSNHLGPIRFMSHPSCSTSFVSLKTVPRFVAANTLKSVQKLVYRNTSLSHFSFVSFILHVRLQQATLIWSCPVQPFTLSYTKPIRSTVGLQPYSIDTDIKSQMP